MDTKQQAAQQSSNFFNDAQSSLSRYFSDPTKAGDITLPKLPEESWTKEPARFANWLAESTVGSFLNLPRNLQVGSTQLGRGLGGLIVGRSGAEEQALGGAGRLLQGALDVTSFIPISGAVGTAGKIATAGKATTNLGKTVAREAGIGGAFGAGYGLAGGLQEAALQPREQRLGTIAQSTALGGLAGGLLGGAIPLIGEGVRTVRLNRLENSKPKITSSLEKFEKQNQEQLTTGSIKTDLPETKLPTVRDSSTNVNPVVKKNLTKKITQETNTTNILPKDKPSQSLIDNINTNIAQGNTDGAVDLIRNAPKKTRKKATKFFVTLINKSQDLDEPTRQNLLEVIKTGQNPTYNPRQSKDIYKTAYQMTQDMTSNDVKQSLNGVSQILDDTIKEFNNLKLQDPNSPITLEGLININLTREFADIYRQTGKTPAEIIGSLVVRAYNEGNQSLATKVSETLSRYGTGLGQSIQSFANLVTPERVINELNDILQTTLLKSNEPLAKEIKNTATELSTELNQINQTVLDEQEVREQIADISNKVSDIVDKIKNQKKVEKEPAEKIAKRIEDSIRTPVENVYEKKEQDLNKDIVNQAYQIIKEIRKESIVEETGEGKIITFNDQMAAFKEMVGNTKKYAEEWDKAKNILKEKYQSDPYTLSKLEAFFDRNIPQVMTKKQIYNTAQKLLKENKYNFYQIVRQSNWNQYTKKQDLLATLVGAFEGVDEDLLKPVVDDIFAIINKRTEKARREAIDRILTRIEPKETVRKTASDKILEAANLGIFDETDLANKFFEMKKLPHLSEADANYIRSQLYLAQLPDGMERKISLDTAYRNIGRELSTRNKLDFKNREDFISMYNAYFYNNIFSSFQTQERNIFGGLFNALVYRPLTLLGEATMQKFYKSADNSTYKDVATYYKAALGGYKNAADRFMNAFNPDYIPRNEQMDIAYYLREYRIKQLPKPLQFVKNFMEASDQFVASIIEDSTTAVLQQRGVPLKDAQEQAFLVSQELLGKSLFKSTKIDEVGVVDAFFNIIGQAGTTLKGKNNLFNLITTPIVPVLRLAINFQKQKAKLFPPLQLINILTKNPTNRKLEDYAYLSIGTALMGFAVQKYLNGEVAFEAPKDEAGKRLFYDSGRKPFSVKVGDYWIPFQYMELLSAPFMFMGAVQSSFKEDPEALTNDFYTKSVKAVGNFVKAFLVSPTYLSNIANAAQAIEGVNGKDWGNVVAYPSTGFIPFIGLVRDIQDIIDPIRRRKTGAWDEWKALYDRQSLEPFFNYQENPVALSQTEIYAPYGIGVSNREYDDLYTQNLRTKQETKQIQTTIEEDKKKVDEIQRQLFVAVNNGDYNNARKLIIENKLTPQQVSSVTNKITQREIFKNLSPQEIALYGLSETDATYLANRRPELTPEISRLQTLKGNITTPTQGVFKELASLNKPAKVGKTLRSTRRRIKKVRAKKFKLPKQTKIKKLKPIKISKLKPLK